MAIDTKTNIQADIDSKFADNAAGDITAQDGREVLTDIKDTMLGAQDAQEYDGQLNFNATILADAANIAWNLDANQVAQVTIAGNRTVQAPTNMKDGSTYILRVVQDITGTRTLTWNAVFKWPGGTAPTLSTAPGSVDIITFHSDGTNMYGVFAGDFS